MPRTEQNAFVAIALFGALSLCACGADDADYLGSTAQALPQMMCPTQVVEGIDVFDGTGTIDWTAVKGSGREFAFIKVSQGNYNKQKQFATNWKLAHDAGVLRSPYHFFDPTVDGAEQAQWFLDALAAGGGLVAGDLPPMLDVECPTSSVQSMAAASCEHSGDSGWVDSATIAQRVFDWLDVVETATGRKAIVYSYTYWFDGVKFTDPRLADYPLYVATIQACALVPAPWSNATFWQYSSTATVPGIGGNCDVDRFFGTQEQLMAFTIAPMDLGVDAAQPTDAATSPDLGGGGGSAGCSCELGSRAPVSFGAQLLVAMILFAALTTRRRRSRRS